jgi:hypothetical protein
MELNDQRPARVRVVVSALVVACMLTPFTETKAQPYFVDGRAYGTVEGGGLRLQFELHAMPWTFSVWHVTPAGVDVYRRPLTTTSCAWERITDEPVPWTWDDGAEPRMSFELLDTTAEPGVGYVYLGRAVDENRNQIPENPDASLGAATHGVALIAHGTLYAGPGGCGESWIQMVFTCGSGCLTGGRFGAVAPEVYAYVNTGTPLLLYGTVSGYMGHCGMSETVFDFASGVPMGCDLPTKQSTWGHVKSLYR